MLTTWLSLFNIINVENRAVYVYVLFAHGKNGVQTLAVANNYHVSAMSITIASTLKTFWTCKRRFKTN
jgi:hypothetical protein